MPKRTKRGSGVVVREKQESEDLSGTAPKRRSARLSKARQIVPTSANDSDDSEEFAGPSRRRRHSESDVSDSDVEYRPTRAIYSESDEDSAGEAPAKKPRRNRTITAELDSPITDSSEKPFEIDKLGVDLSESESSSDEETGEQQQAPARGVTCQSECVSESRSGSSARSELLGITENRKPRLESHNNSNDDSAVESDRNTADSSNEEAKNFFSKHLEAISSIPKVPCKTQQNASSDGVKEEKVSLQNIIADMLQENEPRDLQPRAESRSCSKKTAKPSVRKKRSVTDVGSQLVDRKGRTKRVRRRETDSADSATLPADTKNTKTRAKKQSDGNKAFHATAPTQQKTIPKAQASRSTSKDTKSTAVASQRRTKGQPAASTSRKNGRLGAKAESRDNSTSEDDDMSDGSDWEEVPLERSGTDLDKYSPTIPEGGVEITLQAPTIFRTRKKRKFDPDNFIRLQINRRRKKIQERMHKVHLLCLLAHGLRINAILLDETLRATALSLIPPEFHNYAGAKTSYLDVDRLVKLYRRLYSYRVGAQSGTSSLVSDLTAALENKFTDSVRDYALLFLVVVRCLRMEGRLCVSLYPVTLKADDLLKPRSQKSDSDGDSGKNEVCDVERRDSKKGSEVRAKQDKGRDSDEDFQPAKQKAKEATSSKSGAKKRQPGSTKAKEASKKVKSGKAASEGPPESASLAEGRNVIEHWVEVFNTNDSRWVPVDPVHGSVGTIAESTIRDPVRYVLSFDGDNRVKDVTKKYTSGWLTTVPKQRVDRNWWEETLEPYRPVDAERDRAEELQIQGKLQKQPLPCSIGEFKNHPLYALKRHLLKFQAIYPSDAPTLGFVRGEAVYARECVHTLHSRESWLREARMVRVNEQPYKIVKARPKYDKFSGQMMTEQPLELFGMWQTEEYMPPIAFDGKVPRNAYGNVELYKPTMLPVGTVHLQLPGLSRVAAKLNIDCAPAVVGFEGHHRGAHPVYDGWIVCEEFRETLMEAWAEEQTNIEKRQNEKRKKRIYDNWRKLIKGVLIRERLRAKYLDDG